MGALLHQLLGLGNMCLQCLWLLIMLQCHGGPAVCMMCAHFAHLHGVHESCIPFVSLPHCSLHPWMQHAALAAAFMFCVAEDPVVPLHCGSKARHVCSGASWMRATEVACLAVGSKTPLCGPYLPAKKVQSVGW